MLWHYSCIEELCPHFVRKNGFGVPKTIGITALFRFCGLFPLYRSRGFIRDVEHYAIDMGGFGNNSAAYPPEKGIGKLGKFDGHGIGGDYGTDANDVVIGALVTHYAHGLHTGKDGEVLPDRTVESCLCDLITEDVVGLTKNV